MRRPSWLPDTEWDQPAAPPRVPLPIRLAAAALMGVVGYVLVLTALRATPLMLAKDFTWPWRAARALLLGHDPYRVIQATTTVFPLDTPFFYPLPAALIALPVAPLPPDIAAALFFGASTALLAFAATRDGFTRLLMFTSAPFFMAALNAQWSPLLMAAALLPGAQWLAVAKPNLGLAAFVYRPSRWGVIGGAALLAVSLALVPAWPAGWLAALREMPHHAPPVLRLGGPLLLLALLRWRTREGRFLVAMSCVPQVMYFYDQFMLWLVPRTWREMLFMSAASWVGFAWWQAVHPPTGSGMPQAAAPVMWLVYVPTLVVVLCQTAGGRTWQWAAAWQRARAA